MRTLLLAEPAVIVIDDAHRADQASLRLLVHLAEAVAGAPVVLIATHRLEPVDRGDAFEAAAGALGRVAGAARLDLAGLERADVARLLPEVVPAALADAVWSVSNGNPLLVGELARHLEAGATLATVPRSVRDGVALRLARRSPGCVDVVRFAAVAGRTFAAGLLATVTGRAALQVLADLDEAVAASLVEPTDQPGGFRFVHALVRDAVLATMGTAEQAQRHRDLAVALEAWDPDTPARTLELARLWDAASVLGDQATAAAWCTRAGAVAHGQLAWEDAARLHRRALELVPMAASPLDDHERLLGAARALAQCGELSEVHAYCLQAADAARRAGRPELMAEAVLVFEGRGNPDKGLREVALAALGELPADAHRLRARVHAQLANMAFYASPAFLEEHCHQAELEAARAGDPEAELAALRARNMLSYGPEHAALRLELADRIDRAAAAAGRPSVRFWGPLWRIDALVELGRLPEAVAVVPELRRAVQAAGMPVARWHLARTEAALAQAAGRFAEAEVLALEARDLFARLESPFGAASMYLGFRFAVELHTGYTRASADAWLLLAVEEAPPFIGDLPQVGSAIVTAATGQPDQARGFYRRLPPVEGWWTPPAIAIQILALRVQAAVALEVTADLAPLYDRLLLYRPMHIGSGGGIVSYLGPVELWLGVAAANLQRHDAAVEHLDEAARAAAAVGAPGFAVQATVELAEVLSARGQPGDRDRARALAAEARPDAERLGMAPFLDRIDHLLAPGAAMAGPGGRPGDDPAAGPLSPRELEVAALVASGKTNREIATELYISERTAQNHVQHILTKLGLDNRTRVAAWWNGRRPG